MLLQPLTCSPPFVGGQDIYQKGRDTLFCVQTASQLYVG